MGEKSNLLKNGWNLEGMIDPPTMLHISWKFGQKKLITTRVISILSHEM